MLCVHTVSAHLGRAFRAPKAPKASDVDVADRGSQASSAPGTCKSSRDPGARRSRPTTTTMRGWNPNGQVDQTLTRPVAVGASSSLKSWSPRGPPPGPICGAGPPPWAHSPTSCGPPALHFLAAFPHFGSSVVTPVNGSTVRRPPCLPMVRSVTRRSPAGVPCGGTEPRRSAPRATISSLP